MISGLWSISRLPGLNCQSDITDRGIVLITTQRINIKLNILFVLVSIPKPLFLLEQLSSSLIYIYPFYIMHNWNKEGMQPWSCVLKQGKAIFFFFDNFSTFQALWPPCGIISPLCIPKQNVFQILLKMVKIQQVCLSPDLKPSKSNDCQDSRKYTTS